MDFSKVKRVAIYPAIGIARVGNSQDAFFIGPTIPGTHPRDPDNFRDAKGCIKRQGAQFSVFGLDEHGQVLGEISEANGASVTWRVEIANKKSGWYDFDIALDIPAAEGVYDAEGVLTPGGLPHLSQRRNQEYQGADRDKLFIKPSPQTIGGACKSGSCYAFDDGQINGRNVYLGELRTDETGRLIFLGGRGESASFNGKPLTTFANNQGWHDDTSDGSVDAQVVLPDGRALTADGAWVVTAPPNFAVGVQAFVTGYELLQDVAARSHGMFRPEKPHFYRDIYPMLKHLSLNQWVNAGVQRDFGWGSAYDFSQEDLMERLADPSDANRPFRQVIFESFRNPNFETMEALAWPPLYGDAVNFNVNGVDPRNWYAVTQLQYDHLQQWARGQFEVDRPRLIKNWEDMSPQEQADGMTEAALEETLGGPFHPGCEFTWPMRHASMYRDDQPFRIKRRETSREDYGVAISHDIALASGGPLDGSSPGDITRWMAVPWQSDTSSCLSAYRAFSGEYLPTFWPARVPNDVLTERDYQVLSDPQACTEVKIKAFGPSMRKKWLRGYIYNDKGQIIGGSSITDRIKGVAKFTQEWGKIGIIVKKELDADPQLFPEEVWVETGRQMTEEQPMTADGKPELCSDRPAWVQVNPRKLR